MILEHGRPFGVSRWHAMQLGARAPRAGEKGLVIRVKVRFGAWLGGKDIEADAFVDPGADSTVLSWRWAALARDALVMDELERKRPLDVEGDIIREDVFIIIGGRPLKLPATDRGPRIMSQSPLAEPGDMPGWEDILLGRDFLSAHKLLLVIDGDDRRFSLLLPDDDENRTARARVMDALTHARP